jgi:hypothetical protein
MGSGKKTKFDDFFFSSSVVMSKQITSKQKCPWGGKYADHKGYCNPAPGEEHVHCAPCFDDERKESVTKSAEVLPTIMAPKPKQIDLELFQMKN